jgi:hypothetical protein
VVKRWSIRAMKTLENLFDRNLAWATAIKEKDPDFFFTIVTAAES